MRWVRVLGVLIVAALVQGTLLPAVEVGGVRPDLLLLLAIYVAVHEPPGRGSRRAAFWVGWFAGLLQDVYSTGGPLPFGTTALVFGLLTVAMHRLGTELFFDSAIAQVLILAPTVLAAHAALAVVLVVAAGASAGVALSLAWWTTCYSALAAPLVFLALRPLEPFLVTPSRRMFGRA
ncbi:MAG: rod shape-determining protein MreD [Planctomycetota bacterium]